MSIPVEEGNKLLGEVIAEVKERKNILQKPWYSQYLPGA